MDDMEEADFEAYFGGGNKTWAVTLSDGTVKPLKRDGADLPVTFDERHDYMQTVIETRMAETNDQVGLLLKLSCFFVISKGCHYRAVGRGTNLSTLGMILWVQKGGAIPHFSFCYECDTREMFTFLDSIVL